jgi:hypothetical protein
MMYNELVNRLIEDGIEAARKDYAGDGKYDAEKLAGSIEGFETCRSLQPQEIKLRLEAAGKEMQIAFVRVTEKEISDGEYWRVRSRYAEIEWMANCVSAVMMNEGLEPIIPPTARAVLAVAKIVGVGL